MRSSHQVRVTNKSSHISNYESCNNYSSNIMTPSTRLCNRHKCSNPKKSKKVQHRIFQKLMFLLKYMYLESGW